MMEPSKVLEGFTSEELERLDACPVCGEPKTFGRYEELHDYWEGVPGQWTLDECCRCGCLFLNPRPKVKTIEKAYQTYYTHQSGQQSYIQDNGRSLIWRLANGYMNARYGSRRMPALSYGSIILNLLPTLRQQLDYFYRHLPASQGKLLDVGCGNGVFLRRARDAGWDVVGVDPDILAVNAGRGERLNIHHGTLDDDVVEGFFDVVTSSHVIEHVHTPRAFLKKIHGLLRSDGMVWLATPNARSLGRRNFGRAWRGLEPPRHLFICAPKALHDLLQDAGFIDIRFLRRGRGSKFPITESLKLAREEGLKVRRISPLLVDVLATVFPTMAEELVVVARKP